jgi:hypothetical protein
MKKQPFVRDSWRNCNAWLSMAKWFQFRVDSRKRSILQWFQPTQEVQFKKGNCSLPKTFHWGMCSRRTRICKWAQTEVGTVIWKREDHYGHYPISVEVILWKKSQWQFQSKILMCLGHQTVSGSDEWHPRSSASFHCQLLTVARQESVFRSVKCERNLWWKLKEAYKPAKVGNAGNWIEIQSARLCAFVIVIWETADLLHKKSDLT